MFGMVRRLVPRKLQTLVRFYQTFNHVYGHGRVDDGMIRSGDGSPCEVGVVCRRSPAGNLHGVLVCIVHGDVVAPVHGLEHTPQWVISVGISGSDVETEIDFGIGIGLHDPTSTAIATKSSGDRPSGRTVGSIPHRSSTGTVSGMVAARLRRSIFLRCPKATVAISMALSVPAGTLDGLPIGLQIVGRHFSEPLLLDLALTMERNRPWPLIAPR